MKQGLLTTIEEMQSDIKKLQKGGGGGGDYDEDIAQLKRTTAAHSQAIAGNTQDINELESFQRTATTQISDINDDIDGLQSTTNELQSEIDTNAGNISTLNGKVTNTESDIDTLETTAESHNTRITTNETDIDGLDTRVTALENATPQPPDLSNYYTKTQSDERYTQKSTTTALESRVGNVESDIGTIETGLSNRYTKTETDNLLNSYYTKTQSDGKYATQTDLSTTNGNVATNSNDIDALETSMSNAETDITGLDTRVTALENVTSKTHELLIFLARAQASSQYNVGISAIYIDDDFYNFEESAEEYTFEAHTRFNNFIENHKNDTYIVSFSSSVASALNSKFNYGSVTTSNIIRGYVKYNVSSSFPHFKGSYSYQSGQYRKILLLTGSANSQEYEGPTLPISYATIRCATDGVANGSVFFEQLPVFISYTT